tara:strand:+ start:59 stop:172 length:114 start_codon:yes stop_codon:yes gene_type:complete
MNKLFEILAEIVVGLFLVLLPFILLWLAWAFHPSAFI